MDKSSKVLALSKLAQEGIILGALSILGYFSSYAYNYGYYSYYRVPTSIVTIDEKTILGAIAFSVFGLLPIANIAFGFYWQIRKCAKSIIQRFAANWILIFIAVVGIPMLLFRQHWQYWLTPLVMALCALLIDVVWIWLFTNKRASLDERIQQHWATEKNAECDLIDLIIGKNKMQHFVVIAVVFVIGISFFIGAREAVFQTDYFILQNRPELAILYMDEKRIVGAEFSRVRHAISPRYHIISIDDVSKRKLTIHLETTGHLHPEADYSRQDHIPKT